MGGKYEENWRNLPKYLKSSFLENDILKHMITTLLILKIA